MNEQLLLDTSIVFDLIGLNAKKNYINYENIKKSQINLSSFSLYEFIENTEKFNKNPEEFKINFKKVRNLSINFITNIEINVDDRKLLSLDMLDVVELNEIKKMLFKKIKDGYCVFYNSVMLSLIGFQLRNIVGKISATKIKELNYMVERFRCFFDDYVQSKIVDINKKREVHRYFKNLINRVSNLGTHIFISLTRYGAIGFKYAKKYLRKLKKFIEYGYIIDKDYDFFASVIDFCHKKRPNLTLQKIKDELLCSLLQNIKFKYRENGEKKDKNDVIYIYLQKWIEQLYAISNHNLRIENDMIDFMISDIRKKVNGDITLLPISSDKSFIKIACTNKDYKDYIYFDKLEITNET